MYTPHKIYEVRLLLNRRERAKTAADARKKAMKASRLSFWTFDSVEVLELDEAFSEDE